MAVVPTVGFDETSPAGSDALNAGDNRIREMKTQIREVIGADHKFLSSGSDADNGCHNQVTLLEKADLGTGAVGKTILGSQTVSTKGELVYTDEDDNDIVLTKGGGQNYSAPSALANMAGIMNFIYPVGHIYISYVSTNPATLLGIGTWSAFAAGKVLVGLDSGDTDFDTVGETGGAKTINLQHNHGGSATPIAQGAISSATDGVNIGDQHREQTATIANALSTTQSIMPPFIAVYMWRRTA